MIIQWKRGPWPTLGIESIRYVEVLDFSAVSETVGEDSWRLPWSINALATFSLGQIHFLIFFFSFQIFWCGCISYMCPVGCEAFEHLKDCQVALRKTSVCKPLRQILDSNRRAGICKQQANFLPISLLSSCQSNAAKLSSIQMCLRTLFWLQRKTIFKFWSIIHLRCTQ